MEEEQFHAREGKNTKTLCSLNKHGAERSPNFGSGTSVTRPLSLSLALITLVECLLCKIPRMLHLSSMNLSIRMLLLVWLHSARNEQGVLWAAFLHATSVIEL
ncbi:hypothetical protein AVEN_178903-1 [Araneus ventricosus]|uniref:Uncharacterized protein n=1 Tax=Araneus ventricosus TaxID=182803 RepID=A0A4Y2NAN4_ARAVE|nr:hypothetical protein AVEN_178903-1 [Araneus ventricosus]